VSRQKRTLDVVETWEWQDLKKKGWATDIGFKIKILDALSVVNVRQVRLPPAGLPKIFILKPIGGMMAG
jgi:hypothetical protein